MLLVLPWLFNSYSVINKTFMHPHVYIIVVSQLLFIIIVSVSRLLSSYSGCVWLVFYCLIVCCVSVIPFKVHPHMSIIIVSQLLFIIIVSVPWLLSYYSDHVCLLSHVLLFILYWLCLVGILFVLLSFIPSIVVWLESYLYCCLIPSNVVNYSFHCCHLFLPLLFGWDLICIVVLLSVFHYNFISYTPNFNMRFS